VNGVFVRAELFRILRNRRTVLLSIVMPVGFFFLFSATRGPRGDLKIAGLSIEAYYMVAMATYGATNALLSAGARIAVERAAGWNRQLRLAGVGGMAYFTTKLATAYATAVPGFLAILVLATSVRGVSLPAAKWVELVVSVLFALAPIAALGILVGYLAGPDAIQPVLGLGTVMVALLGGMLVPINVFSPGFQTALKVLPPYWSTYAGRAVLAGDWVGWEGLAVLALWTVAIGLLAARTYRRDTLK
jgi:ABC-2 type transport system permease protein